VGLEEGLEEAFEEAFEEAKFMSGETPCVAAAAAALSPVLFVCFFLSFSFLFFSFHFFFFLPFHPRLSKHALCPVMPKRTFDPLIYQPHFFAGPTDLQCRSRGFRFFEFLGLFAAASSISTRL
jgi:hypothetical protein